MQKAVAADLLKLAEAAAEELAGAIARVREQAPGHGADLFESSVSPLWGGFVSAFMSLVWDRYPDLAPQEDMPADGGYDPDGWNLPRELVVQSSHSLARVQRQLAAIKSLVAQADLSSTEHQWLERWFVQLEAGLDQAQFNTTNQHPDFRGPDPRERIPE